MHFLQAFTALLLASTPTLPKPAILMYGFRDRDLPSWEKILPNVTIVEGKTDRASWVKRLRDEHKVFAYHVPAKKKWSRDQLLSEWERPFLDNLKGELPGGFDAVCIDEFGPFENSSEPSRNYIEALAELRKRHPKKLIIVSGVWRMANSSDHSGPTKLLEAISQYADLYVQESYLPTSALKKMGQFQKFAADLSRIPNLMRKTIFGLWISQTEPYVADDDPNVNFFDFLVQQLDNIRGQAATQNMPGVAFWVFYRAKQQTAFHAATSASERWSK